MSYKKHTKYIKYIKYTKYLIVKIGAPFAVAFWRVVWANIMVSCTKYLIVIYETIIVCDLRWVSMRFITGYLAGWRECAYMYQIFNRNFRNHSHHCLRHINTMDLHHRNNLRPYLPYYSLRFQFRYLHPFAPNNRPYIVQCYYH